MPRTSRMLIGDEQAVYHVMSRTALDGFPIGDIEKDFMLDVIKRFSSLYFCEIMGFCLMGNHFHLLVKMLPEDNFSDDEIMERLKRFYGGTRDFSEQQLPFFRSKLASLSELVRDIKVNFARFYNRQHHRRGYFWGDRFKSVIVDKGETLVNCLAYIDLNPIRAGLVKRPEDYRWNSIGYHLQTDNKDGFLSTDFGLVEFNAGDEKERIRLYREYLYEAGALERGDKGGRSGVIDSNAVESEREKGFEITRADRLRYRTRYFTDSAVIGSKAFVLENFQRFRHLLKAKKDRKPVAIKGLSGMYSLRRLGELG